MVGVITEMCVTTLIERKSSVFLVGYLYVTVIGGGDLGLGLGLGF